MTGPLEPWLQDTAELPIVAAGRRLRLLTILGTCTVVIVALCLGGLWNLNRLSNKSDKPAVAAAPPSALPTQATTPDQVFTTAPFTTAPTTPPTTAPGSAKPQPPVQTVADKPKPTKTSAPATTTPPVPPGPPVQTGVRAGAPCAPRGAAGITAKGTPVVCRPSEQDDRDRWRKV